MCRHPINLFTGGLSSTIRNPVSVLILIEVGSSFIIANVVVKGGGPPEPLSLIGVKAPVA